MKAAIAAKSPVFVNSIYAILCYKNDISTKFFFSLNMARNNITIAVIFVAALEKTSVTGIRSIAKRSTFVIHRTKHI